MSITAALSLLAAIAAGSPEVAQPHQGFALIVGVNQSVDADVTPLRFADDDALQYDRLFRALGFETVLLTTPDEATQRLRAEGAKTARAATERELLRAVKELAGRIEAAHRDGKRTSLVFVYAGHGNIDEEGVGYVSLSGSRLTGTQLGRGVLQALQHADDRHVIVDACASFFLAHERGPGGERGPLRGFAKLKMLPEFEDVGLVLSTSSSNESHEWEGFGAGVFSHEVRSALYGAADVDLDGRVAYRELAAFIERANSLIPNQRYRPEVYVRAADSQPVLASTVSSPGSGPSRVRLGAALSGHYFIEDHDGVRVLEFHSSSVQDVEFVLPAEGGPFWLRRVQLVREARAPSPYEVEAEYELPSVERVEVESLVPAVPRARARGAAHQSFGLVFRAPFDRGVVDSFRFSNLAAQAELGRGDPTVPWIWALSALSIGAAGASVALFASAASSRGEAMGASSQLEAASIYARAQREETAGFVMGAAALAFVGGVVTLWLLPNDETLASRLRLGPSSVGWVSNF